MRKNAFSMLLVAFVDRNHSRETELDECAAARISALRLWLKLILVFDGFDFVRYLPLIFE